jgi:protein-S-isoprenylcysteine O-methyltransferase Ste14
MGCPQNGEAMIYDAVMRLPLLSWVAFSITIQMAGLVQYTKATPLSSASAIHVAMRLSTVTFLLLTAAATILRSRPSAKAEGLEPRLSALAGTFLFYGITFFFPRHELSLPVEIVTIVLTMVGCTGAIVALWQLGQSFSIMAESRQLVTVGPYSWVRHPLYLAEEIAFLGLFMQFASIWTALIFAAQIAFQLRRIHNEEAILSGSFPEYAAYQQSTACLVPGVY